MSVRYLLLVLFSIFSFGINAQDEEKLNFLSNPDLSSFKFRSIGPSVKSGRIADFAFHPTKSNTYYVGAASGGVWRTRNSGTTWEPIFDHEGSYSIGCVRIDPKNTNVLWVGTGEANNQRSVAYGDGIYKSEDEGKTWANLGLKTSEHIGSIEIDARNSNVIYAAAYGSLWKSGGDRGVFKTTDGGKTWKNVLYIDEHTGVSELHVDPKNPSTIYAVAHQRRRHVFTLIDGGPSSGLWKSTDSGETWFKINKGLPSGDLGRIGLAISPVNSDYIYAIVEASKNKGGFYRSTDRGQSWERRSNYTADNGGNYYQEIVCDPENVDKVFSMDFHVYYTEDGGKNFKSQNSKNKHEDNHEMWINPKNNEHYIVGGDGGIYESFDSGNSWRYFDNLPIMQFYRVNVDNKLPFYTIYGGTQDNATLGGPAQTNQSKGIVNADWYLTMGGDGFETKIDPTNPDIIYTQAQYGELRRLDRKSDFSISIKPIESPNEDRYRFNWDSPLLVSHHNPKKIYFAAQKVFKSENRGDNWQTISPDLSQGIDRNELKVMGQKWEMDAVAKHISTTIYGNISYLDESRFKEGLLIAGTDDGILQITEDDGKTWRKIDNLPGIPKLSYVYQVVFSKHDQNTIYAIFNNHKQGDFKPYLLQSKDLGKSWKPLHNNLPKRGSLYCIEEDHKVPSLLFIGSEFGVHISLNEGQKWHRFNRGLPTIAIRDMVIQERENDLVLGSFGRGFYVLDDYSALREYSSQTFNKKAHVFSIKESKFFNFHYGAYGGGYSRGDNYFSAPNPSFGTRFTYYIKEGSTNKKSSRLKIENIQKKNNIDRTVPSYTELRQEEREIPSYLIFEIKDASGSIVRTLRAPLKAGVQTINWDLKIPSVYSSSKNPSPSKNGKGYGYAGLGEYTVSLFRIIDHKKEELILDQKFRIVPLNNLTLPIADGVKYNQFQKKAVELTRVANGFYQSLKSIKKEIPKLESALKQSTRFHPDVAQQLEQLKWDVNDLIQQFSGDRLPSKLGGQRTRGIMDWVDEFDYLRPITKISEHHKKMYQFAKEELDKVAPKVIQLIQNDYTSIQQKLSQTGVSWIPGQLPQWPIK